MKTPQEIFDIAVGRTLAQGARSEIVNTPKPSGQKLILDPVCSVCAYRGPNGLRCPVGHLITDEAYRPEIEGVPVAYMDDMWAHTDPPRALQLREVLEASEVPVTSWTLLRDLQSVHDFDAVCDWPEGFQTVARNNGLEAYVVDQFITEQEKELDL